VKEESLDLEKLRVALRQLDRGRLLIIAERAIEMIPSTSLDALVGDMIGVRRLIDGAFDVAMRGVRTEGAPLLRPRNVELKD